MTDINEIPAPAVGTLDSFIYDALITHDAAAKLQCDIDGCLVVFSEVWLRWNNDNRFLDFFLENFHECNITDLRLFLLATKGFGTGRDMWDLLSRQRNDAANPESVTFRSFVQSLLPRA